MAPYPAPFFGPADETKAEPEEPESEDSGPCLPLHTIEGTGGHFSVMTAYITNPAPKGKVFGMPSVGYIHVDLNHGKHLQAFTVTEALWDRVELGYAYNKLDVGDFYEDVNTYFGVRPGGHKIMLHHFNARVMIVKENDFEQSWLPAVTAGVHYKYNESFHDLDKDLGGGLKPILGLEDDKGVDYTLYASKMLTFLPRPLIVSAGLRSTEAAHVGLLGFTGERKIVAEGALCFLATDKIVLAAEYRQKPDEHKEYPGLVSGEDDWWVLAAGFLPTNNLSVAVGYGHFGTVANHTANRSLGVAVKYEF